MCLMLSFVCIFMCKHCTITLNICKVLMKREKGSVYSYKYLSQIIKMLFQVFQRYVIHEIRLDKQAVYPYIWQNRGLVS